ncbi:MAG: LssY C-terminal domain-containing protein [Afipia sp.]
MKRTLIVLGFFLVVYGAIAYILLPSFWRHYEHQKKLDGLPMVTVTAQGIPADPINVGLVGSSSDVLCAMREAGWTPADPITLRSSLEISGSVLLDRPYPSAPVSPLYYDGRREELAFEKPVGKSADRRHHIRLWMVLKDGQEKRPVWLGAATFDRGVGFSHYTGAVTHHIAPDVDAERQLIETDLQAAGMIEARYTVTGVGPTLNGRNGEGDPYYTDGEVWMMRLVEGCARRNKPPVVLSGPAANELKDAIWKSVADLYRRTQQ